MERRTAIVWVEQIVWEEASATIAERRLDVVSCHCPSGREKVPGPLLSLPRHEARGCAVGRLFPRLALAFSRSGL